MAVGRALLKRPRFCFADEPTGSLDWGHGEQVIRLLHSAGPTTAPSCSWSATTPGWCPTPIASCTWSTGDCPTSPHPPNPTKSLHDTNRAGSRPLWPAHRALAVGAALISAAVRSSARPRPQPLAARRAAPAGEAAKVSSVSAPWTWSTA